MLLDELVDPPNILGRVDFGDDDAVQVRGFEL
jgi:hypothetical protein